MTRHQKRMLKQAAKQICLHILFIVICFVTLIPILYALSVSLNADNSLVSSDFRFIPKNFTLRNYVAVFTEEPVMLWFKNQYDAGGSHRCYFAGSSNSGCLCVFPYAL